jgi:hypothetical protein
VPLAFCITNVGATSVTLELLGRNPTADFRVSDPSGKSIWSRLRGQTLLSSLRLFPLDPGKSLSFNQVWDQRNDDGKRVTPGEYLIEGVLLTDHPGGLASKPARLRIEP